MAPAQLHSTQPGSLRRVICFPLQRKYLLNVTCHHSETAFFNMTQNSGGYRGNALLDSLYAAVTARRWNLVQKRLKAARRNTARVFYDEMTETGGTIHNFSPRKTIKDQYSQFEPCGGKKAVSEVQAWCRVTWCSSSLPT